LQAFVVTEYNEIFLGRQPSQDAKVFQRFGNQHRPHLQGDAGGSVVPKLTTVFFPNHHQNPEEGEEVSTRNVGEPSYLEVSVCPRKFH
jgi:hypothetical protein